MAIEYIPDTLPIGAKIAPISEDELYETHWALWAKGGYRTVFSYADRNGIPVARRESGMLVFLREDRSLWRLQEDLVNWERGEQPPETLSEWEILYLDYAPISDLDGVLTLEPGEVDYPWVYIYGDTMRGDLILFREPIPGVSHPLQAAPWRWVLDQLGAFAEKYILVNQTTPVDTFTLAHDFGRVPVVQLMDPRACVLIGEVKCTTTEVSLRFGLPLAFTIILS
jgi:hypothetical protein